MHSFKNLLVACFCLLALIGLIAAIAPVTSQVQGQGGPPAQNVNVVNTPSVNVTNTPTVNAQQSGAWSVGITGRAAVHVVNQSDTPVLGRDVDEPARQPFQRGVVLTFAAGQGIASGEFTVPANKRLVIEYVSALILLQFTDDALKSVARQAVESKVGARGLMMILEELLLDAMYTLPSQKRIKEFVINSEMVERRRAIPGEGLTGVDGAAA